MKKELDNFAREMKFAKSLCSDLPKAAFQGGIDE